MAKGNAALLKEYRQKIMEALVNNKELCEYVLDRNIITLDSDTQDEISNEHIYKYIFVPNVQEEEKTFITFDIDCESSNNTDLYHNVTLYFFIFSHANIIKDKATGYLITDLIDERVQDLFNENVDFGIGLMTCKSDKYLAVGNSMYGRRLIFRVKDLNKSQGR